MSDTKQGREQNAAEFVKGFCDLGKTGQKRVAYDLAERFAAAMASPGNIGLMADGIRGALNGEPPVARCRPHEKKGHQIGVELRDGTLSP
jgi:hypothetical protein